MSSDLIAVSLSPGDDSVGSGERKCALGRFGGIPFHFISGGYLAWLTVRGVSLSADLTPTKHVGIVQESLIGRIG